MARRGGRGPGPAARQPTLLAVLVVLGVGPVAVGAMRRQVVIALPAHVAVAVALVVVPVAVRVPADSAGALQGHVAADVAGNRAVAADVGHDAGPVDAQRPVAVVPHVVAGQAGARPVAAAVHRDLVA